MLRKARTPISRRRFIAGAASSAALLLRGRGSEVRAATEASALPTPPQPWGRGFLSLDSENDYWVAEVAGVLPSDLRGTLFRNGPGKNSIGNRWFNHWFDGDGMLSAIVFDQGKVHYRNRFVRTRGYLQELKASRLLYRRFGTERPGGIAGNAFRSPKNVANTSVLLLSERLLALWEGGVPTAVDPYNLSTLGEDNFGGSVKTFSAHPKIDPATGELFNFGIEYGRRCQLRPYRMDKGGQLSAYPAIALPYPVMNHDFAITDHYLIFCLGPLVVHSTAFILGMGSLADELSWESNRPTRILLISRHHEHDPIWIETEPFFQFHFANAFEDRGLIMVDLARYPDFDTIGQALRYFWRWDWRTAGMARLARLHLNPAGGKVQTEYLGAGLASEFPQLNQGRVGKPYRYLYSVATPPGRETGFSQLITKTDLQTGRESSCDFTPRGYVGEPIFVPRAESQEEDDGYLLVLVYNGETDRSEVTVLDARDLSAKPLATAYLNHRVPYGFHGYFTRQVLLPRPGLI